MATVSASFQFADGDTVRVSVEVDASYPDCLAEAVHTCAALLREALVAGIVVQHDEDEDDG